jgi:phosphate transport system protein
MTGRSTAIDRGLALSADPAMKTYGDELRRLNSMLVEMGGLVEAQLGDALAALAGRNAAEAGAVIVRDEGVDHLHEEIDEAVVRMLALRQPVARDLRAVVAAIRIAGDLERIGDYAVNIAKRTVALGHCAQVSPVVAIHTMGKAAGQILANVLDAVAHGDAALAQRAWSRDFEVDDLYISVFRELLTYMMEDPRNITPCTHELFMAKNLERIGDHATNIAETVYFTVTGERLTARRPKRDTTRIAAG